MWPASMTALDNELLLPSSATLARAKVTYGRTWRVIECDRLALHDTPLSQPLVVRSFASYAPGFADVPVLGSKAANSVLRACDPSTALVVSALRDCPLAGEQGFRAAERGLDFLIANAAVKRQSGLEHYNVWSFGFALETLGDHLLESPEDERNPEVRRAAARLVEKLERYQTLDGGWGYLSLDAVPTMKPSYTSMSFTTATCLLGLARARDAGLELPEGVAEKAVAHLLRSRLPDGAFLYGEYLKYRPRHDINERPGSACRTPLCHYALELFGEPPTADGKQGQEVLVESLRDLLIRYAGLQRASLRRPIPHESHYAISGYFYLYGHAYAAYVMEALPAEAVAELWPTLIEAVLVCREPDGSFWDYPLYSYHKPYGTGFALQALSRAWLATAEE
jgi:hypothetical protein